MYRLTILSIWRNPLITPLVPGSLSLTWNPSFLCGTILVHPGPRLLVNWPLPPHSLFPPPTVPQSNYAPFYDDITTPTSLSSAQVSLFLHEDISKTWFYMNFWIFNVLVDEIKRKDEITGFDVRLTVSLSSVDRTVHRRLNTPPTFTIWLGCRRFGCLARHFRVHTHTHTATSNYHTHDG